MLNPAIRQPSHAGTAYQPDPSQLSKEVSLYLSNHRPQTPSRCVLVPHGIYYDCGPTMATAYSNLTPIDGARIFIFGLSHLKYFKGCALTGFQRFACPLGLLGCDLLAMERIKQTASFTEIPREFEEEQLCIEIQLPFIARVFRGKGFTILPVYVGPMMDDQRQEYSKLFAQEYKDPKTFFVFTSDLVHWGQKYQYTYHNEALGQIYRTVESLDGQLLNLLQEKAVRKLAEYFESSQVRVCGKNVLMLMAAIFKRQGGVIKVLKYTMSKKVTDKKDSSISYCAATVLDTSKQ